MLSFFGVLFRLLVLRNYYFAHFRFFLPRGRVVAFMYPVVSGSRILSGDIASTEIQAGHDREILFRHYRELVTREDAEAYFTITV